ncbi:MAG TPA: hypothetical protein VJH97_06790 [Candidatus Nanoarchaeia archaeon]|nr:hypothetical protein [Candidatus Nanoarchaeia archaeon]
MKYDKNKFFAAVRSYKKLFDRTIRGEELFVTIPLLHKKAFFSIAPLSRAIHELGGELNVIVGEEVSTSFCVLEEVWSTYENYKKGILNDKTRALGGFVSEVNKKTKERKFEGVFKKPRYIIHADTIQFSGAINIPFLSDWYKPYRFHDVVKASRRILTEGYALKKNERFSVGMVLIPTKEHLALPLEDYLDSYSIVYSMCVVAQSLGAKASCNGVSDRFSMLDVPVKSADLAMTLKGCELDKNVDEGVFKKFKKVSKLLHMNRIKFPTAAFGIHGKGYYGKHYFGSAIGYPTLNKKSRWLSPAQLMHKDPFSPQTKYETRGPTLRYAITETLPLDVYITTCDISYKKLRVLGDKIRDILNKCEMVHVSGERKGKYRTDFKVALTDGKGGRRYFISSDCDVTTLYDKDFYKRTGIKGGAYGNFPSGESFVTPEKIEGVVVGDVVINIDQSYVIPKNKPIVLKFKEGKYTLLDASPFIKKRMEKVRNDAWKTIKVYEKSRSLPPQIIQGMKDNFWRVGEFSINTNPVAMLTRYLIVNEKIARMIHVALGMGFEPDRKTTYHWDIVVNSPRQKFDIYGVDKLGGEHWIIRKGEFVV